MSEDMLSGIRQKIQQLIADAYMTFQGTRGARHGAQPWQKHHFSAKNFLRKIHKMGMFSSILVRFQNDEVFHASQLQQNWKNGANIWITSDQIDISHNAPPEQLERYAALYHFRYDPKQMEKGPMISRPDYHKTTQATVSMNKEAGQTQESTKRHNHRKDLDRGKLDWLFGLSHIWKWYFAVNRISDLNSTQFASPKINRRVCLGKPRSIH